MFFTKRKQIWYGAVVLFLLIIIGIFLFIDPGRSNPSSDRTLSQKELGTIEYKGQKYRYKKEYFNVLFLGIDNESKIGKQDIPGQAGQADTILLLSFHKDRKEVTIWQIPRDTMTEIDLYNGNGNRYASRKMQLALQYAYHIGGKSSCWATKKTVSELLYGLPIDGYIGLDIAAIPVLNDQLGGVKITFAKDYTDVDPQFQKDTALTLNGEQAEQFLRYRDITKPFSNQTRMNRQTEYMRALADKVRENADRDRNYYNTYHPVLEEYLVTDLREDQINDMAESVFSDKPFISLPGEWVGGENHDEFYIDEQELEKLLIESFYLKIE